MKKLYALLPCLMMLSSTLYAQDSTRHFTLSGYLETYYSYDFNNPSNGNRAPFVYSFNRHNEFNLNIGFIRAAYADQRVRANLALMTGTYANANLAAEPGLLKNIYEANAGIRLADSRELWIDVGVFSSHIGFESAVGKDCWNLTRSILADNTPYYESGVRLSYATLDQRWYLAALILNGWQRIQRVEGNSLPSFGTQITFKTSDRVTLNSSTFVGSDRPDSSRRMRYFHNFYGVLQLTNNLGLTVGFDYGIEERGRRESGFNRWFSPVAIIRLRTGDRTVLALRGEYYQDAHGVIIAANSPDGFRTFGASVNFDFQIMPNAVWRIEARNLSGKNFVFADGDTLSRNNFSLTTSLAISLN